MIEILQGDARTILPMLPDASVQCCVTSPPYWGLRDYGVSGQIGSEPTPEEYVAKLTLVFREVRRVLKKDGVCWLNLGDSYANDTKYGGSTSGKHVDDLHGKTGTGRQNRKTGLKAKEIVGIPWRVAFALQSDGWYLRQDLIWHKPNPMPESVTDRCTKAHEYLFLLTRSPRYYWNIEAMREPCSEDMQWRASQGHTRGANGKLDASRQDSATFRGADKKTIDTESGRNKRSVWTVPTSAFNGAHFATFPPDLIRPCILSSSRPGDIVLDPFGGSGTTGEVALEYGRRAQLIELNPEYVRLIEKRTHVTPGMNL